MTEQGKRSERGPYAGGLARREAILDATVEMIAEVGYHGLSLRDVARRVGISHPGVIYHFPSKESLLMAVVQRYEESDDVDLESLEGLEPMEVLKRFIDMTREIRNLPLIVEMECMLAVEASSEVHPAHDHFVQRFEDVVRILTKTFHQLKEQGLFKIDANPDELARLSVALWYGLHIMFLYFPKQVNVETAFLKAATSALDVLKPEAIQYAMTLGLDSPEAMRSIMENSNLSMSDLWEMGLVNVNKEMLESVGLGWVPPEIAQKLIDNGDWTADYFSYFFENQEPHPDAVRAALTSDVLDGEDLAAIMTAPGLPDEVMDMVRQAVIGGLSLAKRNTGKSGGASAQKATPKKAVSDPSSGTAAPEAGTGT